MATVTRDGLVFTLTLTADEAAVLDAHAASRGGAWATILQTYVEHAAATNLPLAQATIEQAVVAATLAGITNSEATEQLRRLRTLKRNPNSAGLVRREP